MRRYTLHAPPPAPATSVPATSLPAGGGRRRPAAPPVLVPEGFSLLAALLPPVWLLAHRLWLPLVIWLALAVLAAFLLPAPVRPYAGVAAQVLMGLQAQDIRRWALARRGMPVAGVVLARDAEAALLRALQARPDLMRSALA